MVRFIVFSVSSLLALSAVPAHAQTIGDVLQGIGRALNGEPAPLPPEYRWREHETERAYWHQQRRLDEEQWALDARRRALDEGRPYEDGNGFCGR